MVKLCALALGASDPLKALCGVLKKRVSMARQSEGMLMSPRMLYRMVYSKVHAKVNSLSEERSPSLIVPFGAASSEFCTQPYCKRGLLLLTGARREEVAGMKTAATTAFHWPGKPSQF